MTLAGPQAAAGEGGGRSSDHSSVPCLLFFFLPSEDCGDTDAADHSRPPGGPGLGNFAPWARLHQVPQGRSSCETEDVLWGWCHPWHWKCVAGSAQGAAGPYGPWGAKGNLRGALELYGSPLTGPIPHRHPGPGGLRVVCSGCLRGEGHAGVTQCIPGSPL